MRKHRPAVCQQDKDFQRAEGQRQHYKALAGKQSGNVVITYIQKYLAAYLSEHLKQQLKKRKNSFPYEILSHYLASSFVSLLTWWLDAYSPYSGARMNEFYRQLVEPGVDGVMEIIKVLSRANPHKMPGINLKNSPKNALVSAILSLDILVNIY